jgi:two-component system, OmpR family, sensor kinase
MLRIEELPLQAVGNLVSALDEIDRMSRIVNSLMTITRLDAGSERMDLEVIDLCSLVKTTMEHMRLLAEEKGLSLSCLYGPEVFVLASPMRMKQVLVNLADNAIKYSLPSGEPASAEQESASSEGISVTVYASGKHAYLKIADHGIGIPPEVLPHVFDRFYRGDFARSREAGGVGLGLAIVRAIVTAHGGTVSITSTPGAGSIVTVELPLAAAPPSAVLDEPEVAQKQIRYQTM